MNARLRRGPFLGFVLFTGLLAAAACGGERPGSGAELWSSAPPGGRHVLVNAWDTLWRVGSSEADTTLLRPFLLASDGDGVYVYDAGSHRVTAFAADGRMRWRFGRAGHGPDEFEKVRDLRVTPAGGVDLLDPLNNRILRLSRDGTVRSRVPLSQVGHAEQMAPIGADAFVLVTYQPDSSLAVMDTAGVLRRRFTLPWPGFERLELLARQGILAAQGGRWVYAFSFGDGWFAYHGIDPAGFAGRFVEHTGFPGVKKISRATGQATKMDGYNACSACSISISGPTLYVQFGGYSSLARRVIDLYDLDHGTYRGSWVLFGAVSAADVAGDRVYVLIDDPYPQLLALRPRTGSPK